MKYLFILMLLIPSVVLAEPKDSEQNSPKLCLETIYNKNFDVATADAPKEIKHLLAKCIAETNIKDFTLIKCSCSQPEDIDTCINKFISSHNFTRKGYSQAVAYHCERMVWSGFVSEK